MVSAALIVAAFLLAHPYSGVRHDGILYLGEALLDLDPARMSQDLFFRYGSQASFSAMPWLYARSIDAFGVSGATVGLLAVSLLAWLAASAWLVRALVSRALTRWSLLVVAIGVPLYGGQRVFAYSETFLTARSVAEPLVLFALGFIARERWRTGCALLVVATLAHPLIAMPAWLAVWLLGVSIDRRWAFVAFGAAAPIAAGLAGIHPFDGLFQRYDDEWMAVVQDANGFVFPSNWSIGDWATVVFDVGVVGWWLRSGSRPVGSGAMRLVRAVLIAGVVGIAAAWLVSDVLANVLLTGLQLWRAHWLLHWTAMALTPVLVGRYWRRGGSNERAGALMLLACLLTMSTFAPAALLPGAVAVVVARRRAPVGRPIVACLAMFCVALSLALLLRQLAVLSVFDGLTSGSWLVRVARIASTTLISGGVFWLALRYLPRRPVVGFAVASLCLATAVGGWDQRDAWAHFQEGYADTNGLLWERQVRPEDTLYWYRETRAPWLLMRHSSYFAANQSSGALFNRRTAMDLKVRTKATAIFELQETVCRLMNGLSERDDACEPDLEAARDVCTKAQGLSFLVLQSKLAAPSAGVFDTGFVEHNFEKTFYLYRCRDIEAHGPDG